MKNRTDIKRISITKQICFLIMGLIIGTVLLCLVLNTTLLGAYYQFSKTDEIESIYTSINSGSNGLGGEEFAANLEKLCSIKNADAIIVSPDGSVIASSSSDSRYLIDRFMSVMLGDAHGSDGRFEIKSYDNYRILKVTDRRLLADYLVLIGILSDGNYIMIGTPMESISAAAKLSNQFFLYIGLLGAVVGVIVGIVITRRITEPVKNLTDISERMAKLDFSVKYETKGLVSDEINDLGNNFNMMSETLESTISDLKTANNKLKDDIEKKEEIDEMRKEFISNVTHELKTPIALIRGYAEGLTDNINDDEESRRFYLDVIVDEAEKMNLMVQKLLTLNRLEYGTSNAEFSRFDIVSLIKGRVESTSLLLEQNDIRVELPAEAEQYVWGDPFDIEEVVSNYISNAINHIDGEKIIKIFLTDMGENVRISVYNTGNHIPEADIAHIWEKFYKVDKARTREYGGSGIGLSIVSAIMQSHHRDYGVKNCEGGVEFYFELDKNAVVNENKE